MDSNNDTYDYYINETKNNPYSIKVWFSYLNYSKNKIQFERNEIFNNALQYLPRSYKLWKYYLHEITEDVDMNSDSEVQFIITEFERSLSHLHKMPRIWINYCNFLSQTNKGTQTRRTFDRAIKALPITQHQEVWDNYINWTKSFGVIETTVKVYRRYLMFDPTQRLEFISYLEENKLIQEAAYQLSIYLNDEQSNNTTNASNRQIWLKLCDLCSKYPNESSLVINVDSFIRSGIAKFSDEVGKLWCSLAEYYLKLGQFDKVRDIYEEALNEVITVRDFSVIYESYLKIEEKILFEKLQQLKDSPDNIQLSNDIDLRLARLEYLTDKRPLLLNSVVLRQNPNNVLEWHKRIKLIGKDTKEILMTYVEAIKSVNLNNAIGRVSSLWSALARYYESLNDITNSRSVYTKALEVQFRSVDESANLICAWAEMEIKHNNIDFVFDLLSKVLKEPENTYKKIKLDNNKSSSNNLLYKNVKVWCLYLDLEESFGTFQTCKAAYDNVINLKIATVKMVLNYTLYLESNNYYEDSFRIFEQSLSLFAFPQLGKIATVYIDKFIQRYGGNKLERLRDIFEQILLITPPKYLAYFYIRYGKTEEIYGLERNAIAIYDRATKIVPDEQKLYMYKIFIKKTELFYGITKTRAIFDKAISELDDYSSRQLCILYADIERKMGEIDRARAILLHGSQTADPKRDQDYWIYFKQFEQSHGNEETFRDMLRVQRSVEVTFSQTNYLAKDLVALANKVAT